MKITIGLPSRNRPLDLVAAILALEKTRSSGYDVDYIVARDTDDAPTESVVWGLQERGVPIHDMVAARPLGLGRLHNRMAAAADRDAVFMLWSDRIVPITAQWDHQIAIAAMQFPQRVLWLDSIHLLGAGQFILPPAWRAAQGDPCPGCYPFWLEDTAVEEIDAYVHGFPRMAVNAKCAGPRTARTTRAREVSFWIRHYIAHADQRMTQAREIARRLGVVQPDQEPIAEYFRIRHDEYLSRSADLEAAQGEAGEPDASYRAAKAAAERDLDAMGIDWRAWEPIGPKQRTPSLTNIVLTD